MVDKGRTGTGGANLVSLTTERLAKNTQETVVYYPCNLLIKHPVIIFNFRLKNLLLQSIHDVITGEKALFCQWKNCSFYQFFFVYINSCLKIG